MMPFEIRLRKSLLLPGELIEGTVDWKFDSIATEMSLHVGWETIGKGTGDSEVVHRITWSPESKADSKTFQMIMPRGPISVRGNLISIHWYVECNCKSPNETRKVPFVLSHVPNVIRLSAAETV